MDVVGVAAVDGDVSDLLNHFGIKFGATTISLTTV
jgi:hypothetical protein